MTTKEMKKEIVKIDPKEFGIDESKAKEIAAQFKPMLQKMEDLESEFNQVMKMPIEEKGTSEIAKSLRIRYVKIRTGTAEIHKKQKAFYLSAGRFVDGWKNTQLFASQGIEEKLMEIEKYAEKIEEKRIETLQGERAAELDKYDVENTEQLMLGMMTDEIWGNFLLGMKTSYEQKKEAEKKSEQDRIAAEKKEAEDREAQRVENVRLKEEAEELTREREELKKVEQAAQAKREAEANKLKAAAEKKLAVEKAKSDKLKAEAEKKLAVEKAKSDKLKAEAEKLAAQVKAKAEAEKKAEREEIAAEKKAQAAPDKEKLESFAKIIENLIDKNASALDVRSEGAENIIGEVDILLTKTAKFIREKLKDI